MVLDLVALMSLNVKMYANLQKCTQKLEKGVIDIREMRAHSKKPTDIDNNDTYKRANLQILEQQKNMKNLRKKIKDIKDNLKINHDIDEITKLENQLSM